MRDTSRIEVVAQYNVALARRDTHELILCYDTSWDELPSAEEHCEFFADALDTIIILTATPISLIENYHPKGVDNGK